METLLLCVALFQTIVILVLGVVFIYFAFRLFNLETNILPNRESGVNADRIDQTENVPLDQFLPRTDQPLKIKYSEKDKFTKQ